MEEPFVTVVSGLPRSGTSMMMRMLEAGGLPAITDGVRQADLDNPRGYYEFEPALRTKEDASWLDGAEGRVVKMVYQLVYHLPANRHYRILLMNRSLDEVLKSQRSMLGRLGRDDGGIPDAKMAQLFESELSKFRAFVAEQPHLRMIAVDYNQMVADPQPQATEVNQFLGGNLDVSAMIAVVEPSLYRNRH